jgi:hypothetical protein
MLWLCLWSSNTNKRCQKQTLAGTWYFATYCTDLREPIFPKLNACSIAFRKEFLYQISWKSNCIGADTTSQKNPSLNKEFNFTPQRTPKIHILNWSVRTIKNTNRSDVGFMCAGGRFMFLYNCTCNYTYTCNTHWTPRHSVLPKSMCVDVEKSMFKCLHNSLYVTLNGTKHTTVLT